MNKKNGADIKGYAPDFKMSISRRAAHYLDWAAKNHPLIFTPYNLVLKAVLGQDATPNPNSKAVDAFRKSLSTTKKILLKDYHREMINPRGEGWVRASIDSGDALVNGVMKKERAAKSAVVNFVAAAELIDPSEFPKTAEFKPYKEHWEGPMKDTLKVLGTESFLDKLTPPKMVPLLPVKK